MSKFGFDHDALIEQFAQASARQGDALRKAVQEATLKALQGRELTLKNIKTVVKQVSSAAAEGAGQNPMGAEQMEPLLAKAVAGMDAALLQAVEANRRALQQLMQYGADLRESQVKKALADIEKMEDTLFAALRKAADGSQASLERPWAEVLKATRGKGTGTGAQASATITQLMDSAQDNLRQGRALGMTVSQAMLDGYSTLVSGVLIGMSDALQQGGAAPAPPRKK
jgi:hypothetical protein